MTDKDFDVWVLGAGFSRAVSERMPLVEDLGERLAAEVESAGRAHLADRFRELDSDFEALLTYLSTNYPWMDTATALSNKAEFLFLSKRLGAIVGYDQNLAVQQRPPTWLRLLIECWRETRTTVVTFNYDTFVEKVYSMDRERSYRTLYLPPVPTLRDRLGNRFGLATEKTFWLLKLHGSLNWLYSGADDFYGEQILDAGVVPGWNEDPPPPGPLDDGPFEKVPLIVPPTTSKSSFFNNETVRSQWYRTRFMLENARRLFFIGYSLPPGDEMVRFMLAGLGREKVVYLVNRADGSKRDALIKNYESALSGHDLETEYVTSGDVLPAFVEDFLAGRLRS